MDAAAAAAAAGSLYRSCWNVAAASSIGIEHHQHHHHQHHCAVLEACSSSSQIPVLWLGKLCFTTISDGVRSISDNLYKTMRQWTINLLVQVLFSGMVMINPRLSEAQQFQLLSATTRALEQLFVQHCLDERLTKALIALACPDRGSRLLVTYLVEVLKGLASGARGDAGGAAAAEDLEAESQDLKAARILCQEYGIDQMYVAAMPAAVRRAVLAALTRDECEEQQQQQQQWKLVRSRSSLPVCSITLEPLLMQPSGKISFDVVAVIQSKGSRTGGGGGGGGGEDHHAFLYRGTALYKWLAKPQVPISPETRSVISPIDVYRLS